MIMTAELSIALLITRKDTLFMLLISTSSFLAAKLQGDSILKAELEQSLGGFWN